MNLLRSLMEAADVDPIWLIKYRTRISGLAKAAFAKRSIAIQAKTKAEANEAFSKALKHGKYGFVGFMGREVGDWWQGVKIDPEKLKERERAEWDFGTGSENRPYTAAELATYAKQHADAVKKREDEWKKRD